MQLKTLIKYPEGIQRVLKNALWLSSDTVFRLIVGVFVGAWIARYLGPEKFGILNYALNITAILGFFSSFGIDTIVIRELARRPQDKNKLLGTAFIIKIVGGSLVFIVSCVAIRLIRADEPLTQILVLIIAFGYIFQSFNAIALWFQSKISSQHVVLTKIVSYILVSVFKLILILLQASLVYFALAGVIEIVIGCASLIIPYSMDGNLIREWRWDKSTAINFLKDSWPLIFSSLSILLYMKMGQVIVGDLLGKKELGIYAAAVRISELWYFIPTAIVTSIFPNIVKLRTANEDEYYRRLQQLSRGLVMIAYMVAIPVSILSPYIIKILYGAEYASAAFILSLHIWAGVFVCLGLSRSQWLIVENHTRFNFAATAIGAVINILVCMFTVRKIGAIGAALAVVIAQMSSTFISTIFVSRRMFIAQLKALVLLR